MGKEGRKEEGQMDKYLHSEVAASERGGGMVAVCNINAPTQVTIPAFLHSAGRSRMKQLTKLDQSWFHNGKGIERKERFKQSVFLILR